jgi:hypothetical protein
VKEVIPVQPRGRDSDCAMRQQSMSMDLAPYEPMCRGCCAPLSRTPAYYFFRRD